MTHTPGPWIDTGDSSGIGIYDMPNGLAESHIANVDTARIEWSANARLIAAAPALLEALERIANAACDDHECRFCDNHINDDEDHDEDCPAWMALEVIGSLQ